jgi:hypothetical protein
MDMISQYIAGTKSTRIATYDIWKLMRKNEDSLKAAILVGQEEKPRFLVARMHRQLMDLRTNKAKQLLQQIMYDRNNAIQQMDKIIERFGMQSVSIMLIQQYNNIISASERGERFYDQMADDSKKAKDVEMRISTSFAFFESSAIWS